VSRNQKNNVKRLVYGVSLTYVSCRLSWYFLFPANTNHRSKSRSSAAGQP